MKSYKEAIGELKVSPMFNLSLSSKELFHSNFLHWLSIIDEDKFKACIEQLAGKKINWGNKIEVKREYLNFDLSVENENGFVAVIENKVKSFPRKEQLDEYEEKVKKQMGTSSKTTFILLSLSEIFPDREDIEHANKWVIRNYGDLAQALRKYYYGHLDSEYLNLLILDYITYVENLQYVTNQWHISREEFSQHSYVGDCITALQDKPSDSKMNRHYLDAFYLRISDYYDKMLFSYFRTVLAGELKRHLANFQKQGVNCYYNSQLAFIVKQGAKKVTVGEGIEVCTVHEFTRGLPLFEVFIWPNDGSKFLLHIQLQGDQYRHAIECKANNLTECIRRINGFNNGFYNFFIKPNENNIKNPAEEQQCEYPEMDKRDGETVGFVREPLQQSKSYCKYVTKQIHFIYQYKRIEISSTIENVFEAIEADVQNIIRKIALKNNQTL